MIYLTFAQHTLEKDHNNQDCVLPSTFGECASVKVCKMVGPQNLREKSSEVIDDVMLEDRNGKFTKQGTN